MYMTNARNLRLVPNATYIPLTRIGGFALSDAKNLRHAKVPSFVLGDAKVPNANGFASQWNIGSRFCFYTYQINPERSDSGTILITL